MTEEGKRYLALEHCELCRVCLLIWTPDVEIKSLLKETDGLA